MSDFVANISRRRFAITGAIAAAAPWFVSCSAAKSSVSHSAIEYLDSQNSWALPNNKSKVNEFYIRSGSAKLFCLDSGGDGPAIVFVHPFSGSAEVWAYQFDYFVEKGFRVIAYSRRGHLGSGENGYLDKENATLDLLAIVDFFKLEKFHLVGIAAGADILPDFADSYSERLLSLSIGCTIGRPGDETYEKQTKVLLTSEFRKLPTWLKELSAAYRSRFPAGVKLWREFQARSLLQRQPMKLNKKVTLERIARIDLPVWLFTGDADLYMPPNRLFAFSIFWSKPQISVFRQAGHAPQWEQPDIFNERLYRFISKNNE
jgi:pimeloyl-ACP methyl ester carboxylesterase